jgi:hypothetical protein
VARQFGLAASTVRAIDLRYLQRWNATRREDCLEQMGVDEIYFGKQMKFITVVSDLETGEPLWFGQDGKQETRDEFFEPNSRKARGSAFAAACVDMWRPFTNSIEQTFSALWPDPCDRIPPTSDQPQRGNYSVSRRLGNQYVCNRFCVRIVEGRRYRNCDELQNTHRSRCDLVGSRCSIIGTHS